MIYNDSINVSPTLDLAIFSLYYVTVCNSPTASRAHNWVIECIFCEMEVEVMTFWLNVTMFFKQTIKKLVIETFWKKLHLQLYPLLKQQPFKDNHSDRHLLLLHHIWFWASWHKHCVFKMACQAKKSLWRTCQNHNILFHSVAFCLTVFEQKKVSYVHCPRNVSDQQPNYTVQQNFQNM